MTDLYLFDDLLTAEERAVRDRVRAWCEQAVVPIANEYWERAEFPFQLLGGLRELGIIGGAVQGHGCPGLSNLAAGLIAQELSRADGSVSNFVTVHSGVVMLAIDKLGSEEQKARWLPRLARLEMTGAFALTEPEHGSDAVALETSAVRDGDQYVLNGRKRWIGNATFAELCIVWARDEQGKVGGFVVEQPAAGFQAEPLGPKISKRAALHAQVELRDVRVPVANRLELARSFRETTAVLTASRVGVAWEALGHAVAAYEYALAYVQQRQQFGKPLAANQLVQNRLSGMLANITSMQGLLFRLGRLLDEARVTPGMASLAKMQCGRLARSVVAEARDLLGGNGILLENHVARHFVDLEAVYSYEGSDAIQSLILGREITGHSAFS